MKISQEWKELLPWNKKFFIIFKRKFFPLLSKQKSDNIAVEKNLRVAVNLYEK